MSNHPKNDLSRERVDSSFSERKKDYESNSLSKHTPNAYSSKNLIAELPKVEKK